MLKALIAFFINFFAEKIIAFIKKKQADYELRKKIKEEAKASLKSLKEAKTKEEVDAAIDKALDDL